MSALTVGDLAQGFESLGDFQERSDIVKEDAGLGKIRDLPDVRIKIDHVLLGFWEGCSGKILVCFGTDSVK